MERMDKNSLLEWLVIGAGPAGIATVGKLLDHGISPEKIGWLDPHFLVGDLGQKWFNVPSNTKVALFVQFLNNCPSFRYSERERTFPLDTLSLDDHCTLKEIAEPLHWVSNHLRKKVQSIQDEALALNVVKGFWEAKLRSGSFLRALNVVLCTGAEALSLPYAHPPSIPLEIALNPEKLKAMIQPEDVVGVFGSSHSAVLVLANLMELKPKMVHNFYLVPHLYAIDMKDWILFDNTGLKGYAATWARNNLQGDSSPGLKRYPVKDPAFEELFATCNKAVYAVGFARRKLPVIEQFPGIHYQESTGIIAPGLFGLGIAYPQAQLDPLGNREYSVGLWKFMDYLNKILPIWLKCAS